MVYNTIQCPVIDLRDKPTSEGEVISQGFFSEHVLVKREAKGFLEIVTMDGYLGWVPKPSILVREEPYFTELKVTQIHAKLYPKNEPINSILTLPFGARLRVKERVDNRWLRVELPDGKEAFIQRGDVGKEPKGLIRFTKKFLGLPYIWGGRSSFGFDCSGFVQMVYQWRGIQLPRDSWQQHQDKRGRVIQVDELKTGDLIFWGKSENKVMHVGMYLENGRFIHTSSRENKPFLRLSELDDEEWRGEKNCYFPYRTVRRFF